MDFVLICRVDMSGGRVKLGKEWYSLEPPRAYFGEYEHKVACKSCLLEVPWGIKTPRLAKSHHWRNPEICQGRIRMELGGPPILGKPVIIYFGKNAHYGKIIYQRVELVYQGRGDSRTQWRGQFEDEEEYDLNYDEIPL